MVFGSESRGAEFWLYSSVFLYFSISVASLLIPIYAIQLGSGPITVGLLAAVSSFAQVPGAIIWGSLADRTGRKKSIILVSLVGMLLLLLGFSFTESILLIFVINAVLWFFISASTPIFTLMAVEGVHERYWNKKLALFNTYQQYGWVSGLGVGFVWVTVIGEYFDGLFAQKSLFILSATVLIFNIPLVLKWFPEESFLTEEKFLKSRKFSKLFRDTGKFVKLIPYSPNRMVWGLSSILRGKAMRHYSKKLKRYFIAITLFYTGIGLFFGTITIFLKYVEFSSGQVFGLFLIANITTGIFFMKVEKVLKRKDPLFIQILALGGRVIIFPLVGFIGLTSLDMNIVLVLISLLFFLIGLTWSFIGLTASGIINKLSPPTKKGEAFGLHTAIAGIGGGTGSIIGGIISKQLGYITNFTTASTFLIISIIIIYRIRSFQG